MQLLKLCNPLFSTTVSRNTLFSALGPNSIKNLQVGRSWKTNELRIKSSEDLHKLYHVLLREKNAALADQALLQRKSQEEVKSRRVEKVQKSMTRLLAIVSERKKLRENYRLSLERDYIMQMKSKLEQEKKKREEKAEENPKFSFALLRSKLECLRIGIDNIDYIDYQ